MPDPIICGACIEVDEATGITLKTGWLDLCRAARGHG